MNAIGNKMVEKDHHHHEVAVNDENKTQIFKEKNISDKVQLVLKKGDNVVASTVKKSKQKMGEIREGLDNKYGQRMDDSVKEAIVDRY